MSKVGVAAELPPNPGTREAQLLGCVCPVIDNHYGDGVPDGKGGRMFWYNGGCPVHDKRKETDSGPDKRNSKDAT